MKIITMHLLFIGILTITLLGCSDTGSNDTGSNDTGSNDTGSNDTGNNDTGSNDTGSITLAAPTNLVTTSSPGKVTLSWNIVDNASNYSICYADVSISNIANCTAYGGRWLDSTQSPIEITDLVYGTIYYFSVVARDSSGNEGDASAEISGTPAIIATSIDTSKLNDTGIALCADDQKDKLPCPQVTHPKQDAETGRDALAKAGALTKIGGGRVGFDFTKITDDSSQEGGHCIKDNHTGLVWEGKTKGQEGGRHDAENFYSWYNPDPTTNGGLVGEENRDGACKRSDDCNTFTFVQAVNNEGYCGYNDWRLPTREELRSIVDYGLASPSIDTTYFSNTPPDYTNVFDDILLTPSVNGPVYWSSSVNYDQESVWVVGFGFGSSIPYLPRLRTAHVRLVRESD